jgi:predicted O-linked N-acetylglucosamine transferase (SPINDLY family)
MDHALKEILLSTPEDAFIVLVAERDMKINILIWNRLKSVFNDDKLMKRIKFLDFSYYQDIIKHSRCVLDTFPYGGKVSTQPLYFL